MKCSGSRFPTPSCQTCSSPTHIINTQGHSQLFNPQCASFEQASASFLFRSKRSQHDGLGPGGGVGGDQVKHGPMLLLLKSSFLQFCQTADIECQLCWKCKRAMSSSQARTCALDRPVIYLFTYLSQYYSSIFRKYEMKSIFARPLQVRPKDLHPGHQSALHHRLHRQGRDASAYSCQ